MTKFCPDCGTKQRSDDARFCSNCGFDFSKLENRQNNIDLDNSTVEIPISSDSISSVDSSSDSISSVDSSSDSISSVDSSSTRPTSTATSSTRPTSTATSSTRPTSTATSSTRPTSTATSSTMSSSNNRTKVNDSKGFFSNLSFNKCFFAFTALLIFIFIIGMISQATLTEPTSNRGLTSFMESSNDYDLSSFLEETSSDSNDDSYDYYSYSLMIRNPFVFDDSNPLDFYNKFQV